MDNSEKQDKIWSKHALSLKALPKGFGFSLISYEVSVFIKNYLNRIGNAYAPLLDIGSYTGDRLALINFPDSSGLMIGLDISKSALETLMIKCSRRILPCQGNAECPPFVNESFNTILLLDILEHLSDMQKCLSEAYRILKPGGSVLIHLPLRDNNWTYYKFLQIFLPRTAKAIYDNVGHDYTSLPTEKELQKCCKELGFVLQNRRRYDVFLQPIWDYHLKNLLYDLIGDRLYKSNFIAKLLFNFLKLLVFPDRILSKINIGNSLFAEYKKISGDDLRS